MTIGKRSLPPLILILLLGMPVQAQIVFEPGVGGSIDKDKVLEALEWSDRDFRSQATQVAFTYEITDWYAITCSTVDPEGKTVESSSTIARTKNFAVESLPRYEAQDDRSNKLSGFDLLGFHPGDLATEKLPAVGSPCAGDDGVVGQVTKVELTRVRGCLFAVAGGMKVGVWLESY
jgi:hypothetical protein